MHIIIVVSRDNKITADNTDEIKLSGLLQNGQRIISTESERFFIYRANNLL